MPGTLITQYRVPVQSDTGTRYQVSATCTAAGTLPDAYVFVKQVVNFDDPKEDTHYRVAAPADFNTILIDREDSIVAGAGSEGAYLYRDAAFTQDYDAVEEALGAWTDLSARINTLVTSYDEYITVFLTAPEGSVTLYPTVDESLKAAYIADYEAALEAITAAETVRDTENVACEAVRLELRTAQESLLAAQQDVAALTPIVGALAASSGALGGISTAIAGSVSSAVSLVLSSGASAPEKSAIQAQLDAASTQTTALSSTATALDTNVYAPLTSMLSALQTRVAGLQADVTSLTMEVNACGLEMATMQGAVDAARGQRDAALAVLRTICPDYVP
jgi:hypothetical protein